MFLFLLSCWCMLLSRRMFSPLHGFPFLLCYNLLLQFFLTFQFPFFPLLSPIIVKCVFSFTISHRRDCFPPSRGLVPSSSSQRGPCPAGETLPSFPAVEQLLPSLPFPGDDTRLKKKTDGTFAPQEEARKWSVDF